MTTKSNPKTELRICEHCKGDIAIRNPTGKCDHLYYPDYCDVCSGRAKTEPRTIEELVIFEDEYHDEVYAKEDIDNLLRRRIKELDEEIDKVVTEDRNSALKLNKFVRLKGAKAELERLLGKKEGKE